MNWSNTWAAASAIVAAVMLLIVVGSMIFRRLKDIKAQNELQLAKQRRIDRDLFGEDPDNPGGPKGPSLRDMMTDIALNTRTLPDRMSAAESRLGKLEDRFDLLEDVVLRRPGGN